MYKVAQVVGVLLCLGLTLLPAVLLADTAAVEPPAARTAALIANFQRLQVAPEAAELTAAQAQSNTQVFTQLDSFFAYDKLSTAALGTQRQAFSRSQFKQFQRDFRALVRQVSFLRSAAFVQQAHLAVSPPEKHADQQWITMHAAVSAQDIETNVAFVWELVPQEKGASWQIVDVNFDGVSFVKDYQNQFSKIIKKDGVAGLLNKISQRLANHTPAGSPP